MIVWSSNVKCKSNTKYLISFNCVSLSGNWTDENPPHQIPTAEWSPEFEISANDEASLPVQAGLGKYYKGSMVLELEKGNLSDSQDHHSR